MNNHFRISRKRHNALNQGFTLVEILLVMALIGFLVSIFIINVDGIFGDAQQKTAETQIQTTFKTPLLRYRTDMGSYPSTAEGLKALVDEPANSRGRWKGPYIDPLPEDPWQEAYQYRYPSEHTQYSYDLWSKGPDRASGTDDDITSWTK